MSGARIVLYDDAKARSFEPFALTRPIATLSSGICPIAGRWMLNHADVRGFVAADHLRDFDEAANAPLDVIEAGTYVVNSRFAPALGRSNVIPAGADVLVSGNRVVGVQLTKPMKLADFNDGALTLETLAPAARAKAEIAGWWHDEVWDFLRLLPTALADDILEFAKLFEVPDIASTWRAPAHSIVLGGHPVIVHGEYKPNGGLAATVEPHVVFDASAGPIFVDEKAVIHSFTRINGPCYIGRNATIMGGDISGCSIGPVSKIRGEISGTIVLGYSNKGHDGFVGNSFLGRWVNLGAGTVTSNLKNTYGEVSLWTPTGIRPTGMQFLGTLFGDHVKTGIGTKLTTGTVLGAGANVFGSKMPPKAVAPFSWGEAEPYDLYRIDKFLASAKTVMSRRKMELTERMARQLTKSFEQRWSVK